MLFKRFFIFIILLSTFISLTVCAVPSIDIKARYGLSDYERLFVQRIVQAESGDETFAGQMLVAQCILNACERENLIPSKMAKYYGYTNLADKDNINISVVDAVSAIFDKGYEVVTNKILFYYAPRYTYSKWHETQKHIITLGGHKFFSLKD